MRARLSCTTNPNQFPHRIMWQVQPTTSPALAIWGAEIQLFLQAHAES